MSSPAPILTGAETKPARRLSPRFHPVEKKRRIVEETFLPHTSVARAAQAHGVNANQVFYWRKQYRQGLLGPIPPSAALLPVQIADLAPLDPVPTAAEKNEVLRAIPPRAEAKPTGTIHLEPAQAKLCIQGAADPSCLRAVLDRLLA